MFLDGLGGIFKDCGQLFHILVRLLNVSIYLKVQHQIFQNERYLTKVIPENASKTLDFFSNVIEMKEKSKGNYLEISDHCMEALKLQSDMSHMQIILQIVA